MREEYLGHHAISDAKFLKGAHRQLLRRHARVSDDLVWIGRESELHAEKDGKPLVLLSTETMGLKQTPGGWRIAPGHWKIGRASCRERVCLDVEISVGAEKLKKKKKRRKK